LAFQEFRAWPSSPPRLLAVRRRADRRLLPGPRDPCRLGDWTVPDRHQRQCRRPASEPVLRGRPARPVLAAGSHLQPSAPVFRRPAGRVSPGRARAHAVHQREGNRKRHSFSQHLNLAERDGISVGTAERHGHPNAIGRPHADADPCSHTNADAQADAHAHPDANTHADANAHAHANPDTHAHANSDTHAHANPDTHAHAHADANTHANPDAHAHANPDARAVRHHHRH
jgi:hypothetical protein